MRTVSRYSRCPSCGTRGFWPFWKSCTLKFIPSREVEIGNDRKAVKTTDPMVERECLTCHAKCYERPVVDAEKWIAK
jgi:hypothetical protein